MPAQPHRVFHLAAEHGGLTLAAALKRLLPPTGSVSEGEGLPWSQVKKLIAGRRVQINGNLCLDEGRKVAAGDVVHVWDHALASPATAADVQLVFVDEHLVVVNKPAGV